MNGYHIFSLNLNCLMHEEKGIFLKLPVYQNTRTCMILTDSKITPLDIMLVWFLVIGQGNILNHLNH